MPDKRKRIDQWADVSGFETPSKRVSSVNAVAAAPNFTPIRPLQSLAALTPKLEGSPVQNHQNRQRQRSHTPESERKPATHLAPRPVKREANTPINDVRRFTGLSGLTSPLTFAVPKQEPTSITTTKSLTGLSGHRPAHVLQGVEVKQDAEEAYLERLKGQGSLSGRLAKLLSKQQASLALFHSNLSRKTSVDTADLVVQMDASMPLFHEAAMFRCRVIASRTFSLDSELIVSFLKLRTDIQAGLDPQVLAKIMQERAKGDVFSSTRTTSKLVRAGIWLPIDLVNDGIVLASRYLIFESEAETGS